MNIWEILGIPPTADPVRIKKTYADRAKTWHPEEYPEEFKRLRCAYQEALRQAKSGTAGKSWKMEEVLWPEAREAAPEQAKEETAAEPAKDETASEPETMERAETDGKSKAAAKSAESAGTAAEQGEPQPQFSYDDVSSSYRKELEEKFFEEFHRIVWNPYLQNVQAVWSYFLFRPAYDDLFFCKDFKQRLLEEICAVSGWFRETLDYFEYWYELYWKPDKKGGKKADRLKGVSAKWRGKKWRSRFTCFMPEHLVSQEMRGEHYAILQIMKDRGIDGSLLNGVSVQAYLKYYNGFIEDNQKWLEDQRNISGRKRIKYWTFGTLLMLLVMALILTLTVKKVTDTTKEKQMLEQKKQEEELLQESREQEEWQQELEERFQNMQEQHRNWTEQ